MTKLIHENIQLKAAKILLPAAGLFCLCPFISSSLALLSGVVIALSVGNPYLIYTRKLISRCLPIAVIGLGAGMNLAIIGRVGIHGIFYTAGGIIVSIILGIISGRVLKVERDTSLLITVGTAICGGSAIAAVAPVIGAREYEISVALSIVFLLNALALLIFPPIGHALDLNQHQFGLWSALAIHDTSSVIGATLQYGPQALEIGTTTKLARALWIIPVAFAIGLYRARYAGEGEKGNSAAVGKAKRPWFVLGFFIGCGAGHFFFRLYNRLGILSKWLPDAC